jgi:hypothetical protein
MIEDPFRVGWMSPMEKASHWHCGCYWRRITFPSEKRDFSLGAVVVLLRRNGMQRRGEVSSQRVRDATGLARDPARTMA